MIRTHMRPNLNGQLRLIVDQTVTFDFSTHQVTEFSWKVRLRRIKHEKLIEKIKFPANILINKVNQASRFIMYARHFEFTRNQGRPKRDRT